MINPSFDALKKLPTTPAAKIIAQNNVVLQTRPGTPANASVAEVLADLDAKGALIDMLQLLSHALPPREATWWACLSARDIATDKLTLSIKAAEAWVLQPGEDTRTQARAALDAADNEDETVLCAMAATFADGTLGPGEHEDYDAPPGAVGGAVFAMALISLFADDDTVVMRGQWLLGRALDIARGGNGRIDPPISEAVTA
ncbi:hypothetical protein DS901_18330 [Loktanella sp. D2R18]|uniref:DUF6931 family protein n=1 Tax=Rhodobacterales TaxID=204455 RepID=UPI000DE8387A|nr:MULTISPECIES: hypothetical protein [Rhodobacterales]MDO6590551.1 hypothetical protein [Yoonia sp. 1_MG-2023]RBW41267.1 hypothetical protein DS901_18330 [Loktanella sp. D2R18]